MGKAASARTVRSHAGVRRSIDACIALAGDARACEAHAPSVSAWSVANHLEHLLRADRWILGWIDFAVGGEASARRGEASEAGPETAESGREAAEAGMEAAYRSTGSGGRPTAVGYAVLTTGFIPRGRGRAPERSRPSGLATREIQTGFREVRAQLEALEPRLGAVDTAAVTLQHSLLGRFTPANWLRFADVHHGHHDKIVRDILAAADG